MKKILILAMALLVGNATLMADEVTLEAFTSGQYGSRGIYGVKALSDGEQYTQISSDGKKIVTYSFRTGQETGVLFDADDTKGHAKVSYVGGYIMAPDGKNLLIKTDSKPIYRRSETATYYIYNVRNKTLEPLSDGGAQEVPVWSHDGTMVAFVRDNNIYLVKLLFGNAESQVTKDGEFNKIINGKPDWVCEEEFVQNSALEFNADDTMLGWVRYDESEVPMFSFAWYKGLSPEKQDYLTYPGAYEYKYPMAGEKNSLVTVHTFDIKSHVIRQMNLPIEKDAYIPRIHFTSDPSKMAIFTLNRHQDQLDIYMANPRSTECKMIVRDKVDRYFTENTWTEIEMFPGGFAYCSECSGYNRIYQYDLTGQLKRTVNIPGQDVVTNFYGYEPQTGCFYYQMTDGNPMTRVVCRTDAKGKQTRLTTQRGTNNATFSANYKYFMNVWSNIDTPPVTTLCDANGRQTKVLEDNQELRNKLATLTLGKKEFFQFTTPQGVTLNGWMLKPANFDPSKRYPVIQFQYSGPGSQQVLDSWSAGSMGSGCLFDQYLGQQGFIVVCVDGRGTGGRGADFEKQTYLHLGVMESEDQANTAQYLATLPYVDGSHIGIWGWSYGGFMTLMSMSEQRGLFYAGVAVAPPTCWRYYDSVYTERFMRTPQENEEGYAESAISRAKDLKGELLICHGLADDNVHFRNTAEYTEALVQADKDFKQLTYTNRNHSIYGGNTRLHLMRQIVKWFVGNLK